MRWYSLSIYSRNSRMVEHKGNGLAPFILQGKMHECSFGDYCFSIFNFEDGKIAYDGLRRCRRVYEDTDRGSSSDKKSKMSELHQADLFFKTRTCKN